MADTNSAIVYVLRNEDSRMTGKVTTDRGGRTRFGIAEKYHPHLDATFYTCPSLQALSMAQQVYKAEYAAPLRLGDINAQAIANKLLDIGVNCGLGVAARMAQTGVSTLGAHVEIDGKLGPSSIAAINQVDPAKLMGQLIVLSQEYYRMVAAKVSASPNEIASWLTRAGKAGV